MHTDDNTTATCHIHSSFQGQKDIQRDDQMLSHTHRQTHTHTHRQTDRLTVISGGDAEDVAEDALKRKLIQQRDHVILLQETPAVDWILILTTRQSSVT